MSTHQDLIQSTLESAKRRRIELAKQVAENDQLIAVLSLQSRQARQDALEESILSEPNRRPPRDKVTLVPLTREHIETVLAEGALTLDEIVKKLELVNPASRSTTYRFLTAAVGKWLLKSDQGFALKADDE